MSAKKLADGETPMLRPDALLTTSELAPLLSVSESFLTKARLSGDGPPYRKLGRSVRYLGRDVLEWLKARRRSSTSEDDN